jgi:hypothetical protein
LGTLWEHIGSKGEIEKVFWHTPELKRKIVGALKCMIGLLIACMYSLFWKLSVMCFWHQLFPFIRAWVWFNIIVLVYIILIYLLCFPLLRWDGAQVEICILQWSNLINPSPKRTETWQVPQTSRCNLKGNVSSLCPVM